MSTVAIKYSPPIVVTAGASEDVEVTITERTGQDIHAAVVSLAFTKRDTGPPAPGAWVTATGVTPIGTSQLVVLQAVDATLVPTAGWWTMWVRMVVGGQTIIRSFQRAVRAE